MILPILVFILGFAGCVFVDDFTDRTLIKQGKAVNHTRGLLIRGAFLVLNAVGFCLWIKETWVMMLLLSFIQFAAFWIAFDVYMNVKRKLSYFYQGSSKIDILFKKTKHPSEYMLIVKLTLLYLGLWFLRY